MTPNTARTCPATASKGATGDAVIRRAIRILEGRLRTHGPSLSSPVPVKDYLRLRLAGLEYEVFVAMFLDSQNRLLAAEDLFRGTLAQTSVYPREVVKAALKHNAAAVTFAHNRLSAIGILEPRRDRHKGASA